MSITPEWISNDGSAPVLLDVQHMRGDTAVIPFVSPWAAAQVAAARFMVRRPGDDAIVVSLTLANNPTQWGITTGASTLTVKPDDTEAKPAGEWRYDIELTHTNGAVRTVQRGQYLLRPDAAGDYGAGGALTAQDAFDALQVDFGGLKSEVQKARAGQSDLDARLDLYDLVRAEVQAARGGKANLDARLDALEIGGSHVATLADGGAAEAQKVVTVDDTAGFLPGAFVVYELTGGGLEYNQIASVDSETQLTLVDNVGAGGIGDDAVVAQVTAGERDMAGGYRTPGDRLSGIDGLPGAGRLGAGVVVTDMTIQLRSPLTTLQANSGWVVIDPYTEECEIRRVAAIAGDTLTLDRALEYGHSADDAVLFLDEPTHNVKHFGARGDGGTNDTAAFVAWAAAVAAAENGVIALIPAGEYIIDPDTVVINAPAGGRQLVVRGQGAATVIKSSGVGSVLLEFDGRDGSGADIPQPRDHRIEDLYINAESYEIVALYVHHVGQNGRVSNCHLRGAAKKGTGLLLHEAVVFQVIGCSMQGFENGLELGGNLHTVEIEQNNIVSNEKGIWKNDTLGSGTHIVIHRNRIDKGDYGIHLSGESWSNIVIHGNRFEEDTTRSIYIQGFSGAFPMRQIHIDANRIVNYADTAAIELHRVIGFSITNNHFRSDGSATPIGNALLVANPCRQGFLSGNTTDPERPINHAIIDNAGIFDADQFFEWTQWSTLIRDEVTELDATQYVVTPVLRLQNRSSLPAPLLGPSLMWSDGSFGAVDTPHLLARTPDGFWQRASFRINPFSNGAPTSSDDASKGYHRFSLWIDASTSPDDVYICVDPTPGAAVWRKIT